MLLQIIELCKEAVPSIICYFSTFRYLQFSTYRTFSWSHKHVASRGSATLPADGIFTLWKLKEGQMGSTATL